MSRSLFESAEAENRSRAQPLPARMRPRSLDEFVGQQHFLGKGKLLRRLLGSDRLGSVIFYGPPGTGKTTLARLLASESKSRFQQTSALTSGVKELRAILDEARDHLSATGERTLLFVDEIHRFNRNQQDVLLHDVEDGIVILVGATTPNPFFALVSALVSRSQIFQFKPLTTDEISAIPDVVVTCAPIDPSTPVIATPVIIVELASPSGQGDDSGLRWLACRKIASLKHDLVVAQDQRLVHLHPRAGDIWCERFLGEGVVELDEPPVTLEVDALYAATDLAA